MFIDDIIKILYSRQGYLPDWPYHLISVEEMCDAFIRLPTSISDRIDANFFGPTASQTKTSVDWFDAFLKSSEIMFFKDNYPLVSDSLKSYYKELVNRIFYEIQALKADLTNSYVLPNWIYSYMIGAVIGPSSDKLDIHDMISAMGVDNIDDEYTEDCCIECLKISNNWLKKLVVSEGEFRRPPTMFGEPHVLKSIRLDQESLSFEDLQSN